MNLKITHVRLHRHILGDTKLIAMVISTWSWQESLQWRHNGRGSVSNHQPHHCLNVDSDADQRNHQSSASLAFVRGINRGPMNSPHKRPVTRKMFPFDDVIMILGRINPLWCCIVSRKYANLSALSMVSRVWDGVVYWNSSSWNIRTCLWYYHISLLGLTNACFMYLMSVYRC